MASAVRPLVLAFLAFLAGLLPGLRYGVTPLAPLLAASALILASGLSTAARGPRRHLPRVALLSAFALIGLALGAGAARSVDTDCRRLFADGAELRVRGLLAANVLGGDRTADLPPLLPLEARAVWQDGAYLPGCEGPVRVRFPPGSPLLEAGSALEIVGSWSRFPPPVVRRSWPADPRFVGFLRVEASWVLAPAQATVNPLLTLRGRTESHLHRLFPQHGPLADGLLLGRRERIDPALRERFARAGLAHLLAISGMHVGLIAGMLLLVARWWGRWWRLPKRVPVLVAIGGVLVYLAMIGAPPSAVRAGLMISLALLGLLLQRPYAPLPLVSAAALLILLHRPTTVLEPGFQLSFLGVLGILTLHAARLRRLPPEWQLEGWRRSVLDLVVVSAAAFAATAPVVVWHFGLVSWIGLIANVLAIPLMGISLAGIVVAALLEPLLPAAGRLVALGTEVSLHLLDRVAAAAAAIPYGHVFLPRPALWACALALVLLLLVLDAAARLRPLVRWAVAAVSALLVLAVAPVAASALGVSRAPLELHFLDVGQGDAIAIRTPGDRWVLVDAGPADDRFDAGERRVLPFLRAHGVRRLEALILTHPHLDHIGGAPAVLRSMPVGALIEPGYVTGSPKYLEVLRSAEARDVRWIAARSGRVLELDGVRFEILWPDARVIDQVHDANEISTVVLVRRDGFAALLTGDAYAEQEWLLARRHGPTLRAQVLKAGHHGSYTSTSRALLEVVRPELVVISAGRRNRFGHPSPEVLRDLESRGIRIARTDRLGTVSVIAEPKAGSNWWLLDP
jgi:competence protein ComEC